jgi:hypothetical protein
LIELLATLYFPLEIKMLWLNRACAPWSWELDDDIFNYVNFMKTKMEL